MAKHMRLQHNISPPLPGRGGNRKRKRDDNANGNGEEDAIPQGYNAFKVEGTTPTEFPGLNPWDDGYDLEPTPLDDREYFASRRSVSPDRTSTASGELGSEEGIPSYLRDAMDPQTGKIHGRSPAMVKYLVMKAKHRYVLEQHENLLEELRVVRYEERRTREEKEEALDLVLGAYYGCANLLIPLRLCII